MNATCGVEVALYGVEYGDLYEPCAKPRGHDGGHDPSWTPPARDPRRWLIRAGLALLALVLLLTRRKRP